MSDPTQPVEGTPTSTPDTSAAPSAPETTPDPYAPVYSRVDELAGSVGDLRALVEQRLPAPEPQPEEDPWAALFPQEQPEPEYEPQPQFDPAAIQNAFNQALQQANAPLLAQVQQMQAERAREQLLQRVPQLQDPAIAQQTIDSMVTDLRASQAPDEVIQWALSNPTQIEKFFKAAEAEKLAQGQAPAGEPVPSVESAGGALPGGNGAPMNIAQQVYANRPAPMPKGFR